MSDIEITDIDKLGDRYLGRGAISAAEMDYYGFGDPDAPEAEEKVVVTQVDTSEQRAARRTIEVAMPDFVVPPAS